MVPRRNLVRVRLALLAIRSPAGDGANRFRAHISEMIANGLKLAGVAALVMMSVGVWPLTGQQSPLASASWLPSPCVSSRLKSSTLAAGNSNASQKRKRPPTEAPLLGQLRNHAAAFDLMGNSVPALRVYPGFGHCAFDDVPLNPSAFWASKRSQILARRARLNRRELHWNRKPCIADLGSVCRASVDYLLRSAL
jgi:hypothetical protein